LVAYATALETEATSPYPVRAFTPSPMPQPRSRSGPLVSDDGNPTDRERSARMTKLRDAERALERALRVDSGAVEARVRLAHVRVVQKKDDQAIALLKDALASKPPVDWTYIADLMLGDIYQRAGQIQAAKELYESAV